MHNVGIIFRREFRAYFDSSIAYIFMIVFLLLTAGLFMTTFFLAGMADMRGFFGNLPLFNLFFLPAVTMRLWAEDKRIGTMELLMTLPMKGWEIVLGKYLAAFAFYAIALAGTLTIPITLAWVGNPDMGAMLSGYVGSLLLGAFYLAVGIFASGLFKDQIVAFIVALMFCLIFFFIGSEFVVRPLGGWVPGLAAFFENYVGITTHFADIQRGVIDLRNVLYFVSMSALFLVLNTLSLEGRRY